METKKLLLTKIRLNKAIQPRVELDHDHVKNYVEDLLEGAKFPPVVVFYDGVHYWLSEGFHRYMAHQHAGKTEIMAEIHEGGMREAIMHAVGSNATHGKRRTNADKRKVVGTLLEDKEWCVWSDHKIAEVCRVSQPFVGNVRKEMTDNGFQFPTTRKGSDGREIDTSKIGSTRPEGIQKENTLDEDQSSTDTDQESEIEHDLDADEEQNPEIEPISEGGSESTDEASQENETDATDDAVAEDVSQEDESEATDDALVDETSQENEADAIDDAVADEASQENKTEATEQDPEQNRVDNEIQTPETEEMTTESSSIVASLNQKVIDLETALTEAKHELELKNDRISELEDKVKTLEKENAYYQLIGVKKEDEDLIIPVELDEASKEMEALPA